MSFYDGTSSSEGLGVWGYSCHCVCVKTPPAASVCYSLQCYCYVCDVTASECQEWGSGECSSSWCTVLVACAELALHLEAARPPSQHFLIAVNMRLTCVGTTCNEQQRLA